MLPLLAIGYFKASFIWGTLTEIVSDNGTPFVKALAYLGKKYHI